MVLRWGTVVANGLERCSPFCEVVLKRLFLYGFENGGLLSVDIFDVGGIYLLCLYLENVMCCNTD